MYTKDQAIVLAKRSADDASNFFILYTQKRGLQKVKVRGAKKILSKMAGHLEPPALVEVFMAAGKKINYIAGANLVKRFELDSLEKYRIQFWLAKLIMQLIRENSGDLDIWILLNDFYKRLEKAEKEQELILLKNIFLWQFGSVLGYKAGFEKCIICKNEFGKDNFFDFEKGGAVCSKCYKKEMIGKKISNDLINLLKSIDQFEEVTGNEQLLHDLDDLSRKYWQYRFEVRL